MKDSSSVGPHYLYLSFNLTRTVFIPNNDVAKPRKRRIQAGLARGATWERTYTDEVTHIIVDIELDYPSISKAFKDRDTPQEATILKDTWLIESIKYGYLQNEEASRYRLKGAPVPPPVSDPATIPMQVGKRAHTPDELNDCYEPKTQKRKLNSYEQQETPSKVTPERPEDDLDKIIQEFKNNKQYVSVPSSPIYAFEQDIAVLILHSFRILRLIVSALLIVLSLIAVWRRPVMMNPINQQSIIPRRTEVFHAWRRTTETN